MSSNYLEVWVGPWFPDATAETEHMANCLLDNPTWIAIENTEGHLAYCHPDNAELIAAAPDLLDALREMLCQFADHEQYDEDGYDTTAINKARAAIAKAEGELK